MTKVAIAQQKGGVGKSTLVINLAVEACTKKKKVFIVDCDNQKSCVTWKENRDIALGKDNLPYVSAVDLRDLKTFLESLEPEEYDYIFFDLPGKRASDVNTGIGLADFVLIPTRPNEADFSPSMETASSARRLNKPYLYILNIADPKKTTTHEFKDLILESGQKVSQTILGNRSSYESVIDTGYGISEKSSSKLAKEEIQKLWREVLKELKNV